MFPTLERQRRKDPAMTYGYTINFTERARNRVIAWQPDTGAAWIAAGAGSTLAGADEPDQQLRDPYSLAVDGEGHLLIADKLRNRVVRMTSRLETLPTRGVPEPGSDRVHLPITPTGLVVEADGSLLISQGESHGLYRRTPDGQLSLVAGTPPWERLVFGPARDAIPTEALFDQPLDRPTTMLRRRDGSTLFIERGCQVVRSYHPERGMRLVFPLANATGFRNGESPSDEMAVADYHPLFPTGLAEDAAGRWYLADASHRRVWQIDDAAGRMRCVLRTTGTNGGPAALTFGPDGTLWVLDYGHPGVRGLKPQADGSWSEVEATCQGLGTERLHCSGEEGAGIVCVPM